MRLMDFYRKIILDLGLGISDKDYILPTPKDKVPIIRDGKPLTLPTAEHLNSVYEKDEDGNVVPVKTLYNPLSEDIVKGDTTSLKATKDFVCLRLSYTIAGVGELLLLLASNPELQHKTPLKINKFLSAINQAQQQGIKRLVDEKSIDNWTKLFSNSLDTQDGFMSIFLKKRGKYQNIEYNRLAVLNSQVYDELSKAGKEPTILGVKLRNKDVTIFKLIFEFLIKGIETDGTISIGSNDNDSPAFISLFKMYLKIMSRCQDILEALEGVNPELHDSLVIEDLIDESVLDNIAQFNKELLLIPNDNDINRNFVQKQRSDITIPNNMYNTQAAQQAMQAANIKQPYPTDIQPVQQTQVHRDPMERVAYDNYFTQQSQSYQPTQQPTELIPGYNANNSLIPGYQPQNSLIPGYQPQPNLIPQYQPSINTGTTFTIPAGGGYNQYQSPNQGMYNPNARWI